MKSLHESIMQSRELSLKIGESILSKSKVGVTQIVKSIFEEYPSKENLKKLQKIWDDLGLSFNGWRWSIHPSFSVYIFGSMILYPDAEIKNTLYIESACPSGYRKKVIDALHLKPLENSKNKYLML